MMRWFFSTGKWLRRPSRPSRRAPRRNRSWMVEDLEGRRLPSQAIQPLVTLHNYGTSNLISGPGGDLWLGVNPTSTTTAIDRIGLDGSVTSFPVPLTVPESAPYQGLSINSVASGPDGKVWFVAGISAGTGPDVTDEQVVIGNVTPAGVVTEYPPIPVPAGFGGSAGSLISGPDDDLWFGYAVSSLEMHDLQSQAFVGRVTTDGAVTLFPIDSLGSRLSLVPSLATGADGNLWFAEGQGKSSIFGRMSPSGVVTPLPIDPLISATVADGVNGSLVLTGANAKFQNEVFRVTTDGAVTRVKVPARVSEAFVNDLGPANGSLWFGNGFGSFRIGQITASGVARSHNLSHRVPGRQHTTMSMAPGPNGDLYVLDTGPAEQLSATIDRLSPSGLAGGRGAGRPLSRR